MAILDEFFDINAPRDMTIAVRVSLLEKSAIIQRAATEKLSMADYCRRQMLNPIITSQTNKRGKKNGSTLRKRVEDCVLQPNG